MELIDKVNSTVWSKMDSEKAQAWPEYTIITSHIAKPGEWNIAVKQLTDEGDIPHMLVKLSGGSGKLNPLQSVRNCQLLVDKAEIVGINLVDDCIVKKSVKIA